jgi:hypothetical protein
MQHHDPQRQNPEHITQRDAAPRRDDDDRDRPSRQAASLHDLPPVQSPSPRKYYEF